MKTIHLMKSREQRAENSRFTDERQLRCQVLKSTRHKITNMHKCCIPNSVAFLSIISSKYIYHNKKQLQVS